MGFWLRFGVSAEMKRVILRRSRKERQGGGFKGLEKRGKRTALTFQTQWRNIPPLARVKSPPAVQSRGYEARVPRLGPHFVSRYYDILPVNYASAFLSQLPLFESILASWSIER